MSALDNLARKFRKAHQRASWEQIGWEHGISGGLAYKMAMQGYEPKDKLIRDILGLPPKKWAFISDHNKPRAPRSPWLISEEEMNERLAFVMRIAY